MARASARLAIGAALAAWLGASLAPTTAFAGEAELRAAIERFVRERAPAPPTAVEVPALSDFAVDGPAEVRLSTHPREKFLGRVPVTVALRSGDRELKRGVVTVAVRVEQPVLVAARPIRRGERLGPRDVRVERRDAAELPAGWLGDAEAVRGRRARRSLRAGEPLAAASLESAPLVERGQVVRLALRRGSLRIEAAGEARADGRAGDWIKVVNRDSRRELVGRVGDDGVVHVAF